MIGHPLDRPAWSALTGRQAPLSTGDARARRYLADASPFGAACDDASESLAALAALVPEAGNMVVMQAGPSPDLPGAIVASATPAVQLTTRSLSATGAARNRADIIMPLSEADAPEMLALATLTVPGPFLPRTHELGDFFGIRQDGRLVAMAGERMKPDGFTEVSGVCTHPDWRGRGYAGLLSRAVADRILARGETAFLHSYASNEGAITLYRSLGFEIRSAVMVTVYNRAW